MLSNKSWLPLFNQATQDVPKTMPHRRPLFARRRRKRKRLSEADRSRQVASRSERSSQIGGEIIAGRPSDARVNRRAQVR
jgi:hypothetical protein